MVAPMAAVSPLRPLLFLVLAALACHAEPENDTPYKGPIWCVLSSHAAEKLNETAVGDALTYACGQGNGTCDAIQPGGACFQPNTGAAHASYAFNNYWQQFRKIGATCYFNNLAEQTIKDPSYGSCKFQSSLG